MSANFNPKSGPTLSGRRALLASLCLALLWARPADAKVRVPIGTGLSGLDHWGTELPLGNCEGYGKHGRWGALEYITQPRAEAPKFDALMRFIEGQATKKGLP